MGNVSVDINSLSFYSEPNTKFYRFKRKLTMMPILKEIRKIVGKNRTFSLLEIGTGSGFLITFLESEFPNAKLTGIEYDSRLVKLTQSKVKNATVIQGNAEDFNLNDKKFDIIVSLQVIEHLYQPELMLKCVKNHLNKNGTFIFTTPNLEGIGAKFMKDKWHGFRTDHVSLKSYTEWKAFAEQNGFTSSFCGSTFFTGIPLLNKLPLGLINWGLLFSLGSIRWKHGESFIGIFKVDNYKIKD